jgi:hypothetical protein
VANAVAITTTIAMAIAAFGRQGRSGSERERQHRSPGENR